MILYLQSVKQILSTACFICLFAGNDEAANDVYAYGQQVCLLQIFWFFPVIFVVIHYFPLS